MQPIGESDHVVVLVGHSLPIATGDQSLGSSRPTIKVSNFKYPFNASLRIGERSD